jgi:hypothetical protein
MDPSTILFLSFIGMTSACPDKGGDSALMQAYMQQSGIQQMINASANNLQKRMLTDDERFYLGYTAYLTKIVTEKKIVIQWRF